MIEPVGIAQGVDKDQMFVDGVELVGFDLAGVVHPRAAPAQFLHEDPVAQMLGRNEIAAVAG